MSTLPGGSWPSLTAANSTIAPPVATSPLASPILPAPSRSPLPPWATSPLRWSTISWIAIAGAVVLVAVVAVIRWLGSWCQRRTLPSVPISCSQRSFTLSEIQGFTCGFSQDCVIGEGGFAVVYRGVRPNGEALAVKRLKGSSSERDFGFRAEVKTVGHIHHKNVVSLVGYCREGSECILVYELVPGGSLDVILHGQGRPSLAWEDRMKVAISSAKGLAHLHEDCHPTIVHRDIKPANILVDSDFEAKIADFGYAKFASDLNQSDFGLVFTCGYLAPESYLRGEQTEKSDVYSFGIVLLELITGQKAVAVRPLLPHALEDGNFDSLIDRTLQSYDHSQMTRMVACAAACIRESAQCRPKMSLITRVLEGHQTVSDLDAGNADLNDGIVDVSSDSEKSNSHDGDPTAGCASYPFGLTSEGPSHQTAQDLEMGRMAASGSL